MFVCGEPQDYKLGVSPVTTLFLSKPCQLSVSNHQIVSVVASFRHTFLITAQGLVLVLGYQPYSGISVDGISGNVIKEPQVISSLRSFRVVELSSRFNHHVCRTTCNRVFVWGM